MSLFSRLFGRASDDPANPMIEFLSDKSLDDRRIVAGILYGGPFSLRVQKWVLSRPDCDKGTAAMLLWNFGTPDTLIRGPDRFPLHDEIKKKLIVFVVNRWREGGFAPAVFEWDMRDFTKPYRRELKKRGLEDPFGIPGEAWQPIQGRQPQGSPAVDYREADNQVGDLLDRLRLADLAAINPKDWEPVRRKRFGLN